MTLSSYKPMYIENPNLIQTCSNKRLSLLCLLQDSIVMQHNFTPLPLTPSMLWHLCQMNKHGLWLECIGGNEN
jgi:hypothetical protein